jgi:hypothetical protein
LPALGPTGPWTDVYALALLCVELMHGRPVTEGSAVAALARTRDDAVQPTPRAVGLEVPAAVEAVMTMAMAMRPMQRYQDVGRFWAALRDSLAASQPVPPPPSRPPSAPATSPRPAKLARRVWVLGAGCGPDRYCGRGGSGCHPPPLRVNPRIIDSTEALGTPHNRSCSSRVASPLISLPGRLTASVDRAPPLPPSCR